MRQTEPKKVARGQSFSCQISIAGRAIARARHRAARISSILTMILVSALSLAAQNVRWDFPVYTTQAQGGNLLPVYAVPGAGVLFYSCTGSTCTTLATTYISATSSTTCPTTPTPAQVVLNGTSTCVSTADPYGNMGGWFQAGQYMATISALGSSYNYFFTVASGSGGGGTGDWPPINIMAAPFYAACNGVTDDTTAVQNASTAACSANTGIYVPATAHGCNITKSINLTLANGCNNFSLIGDPSSGINRSTLNLALTEAYPALDYSGCTNCGLQNMNLFIPSGSQATVAVLVDSQNNLGGGYNFGCYNSFIGAEYPSPPTTIGMGIYAVDQPILSGCNVLGDPNGVVIGNGLGALSGITSKFGTFPTTSNPGCTQASFNNVEFSSESSGVTGSALQLTGCFEWDFNGRNYIDLYKGTSNTEGIFQLLDNGSFNNIMNGEIRTEDQGNIPNICLINLNGAGSGIQGGHLSGSLNGDIATTGGQYSTAICGASGSNFIENASWTFNTGAITSYFNFPGSLLKTRVALQNNNITPVGTIGSVSAGSLSLTAPLANIVAGVTNGISNGAIINGSDASSTYSANLISATGTASFSQGSIGSFSSGYHMNLAPNSDNLSASSWTYLSGTSFTPTYNVPGLVDPSGNGTYNATELLGTTSGNYYVAALSDVVQAVTGTGGSGMTPGTYALSFSPCVGTAAGTITVLTPTTYTTAITNTAVNCTSLPTVTAATGGTPPTLTAVVSSGLTIGNLYQMCFWNYSPNNIPIIFGNQGTSISATNVTGWGYNCGTVGPIGSSNPYVATIFTAAPGAIYIYGVNIAPIATPSAGFTPTIAPITVPVFNNLPAYQPLLALTTTGAGAATLSGAALNIPANVASSVISGTSAPSATCSSSVNTFAVEINATPTAYQCSNATGSYQWNTMGGGSGSVTTVSVVTANGVSGTVANPTTTPAITLSLGAITPTSVVSSGAITSTAAAGNAGIFGLGGNTANPSIPSNQVGFLGPTSASFTSYFLQFPTTAPASNYLQCAAPSANVSTCSWATPAGSGTVNSGTSGQVGYYAATGTAISGENTVTAGQGGTGVANTATLTLGTSNVNLATLPTGIVKNTTTTGALSDAAASDVYGLWTGTCSSSTFLRGDGACAAAGGVTSFSGDGTFATNSSSTGGVTLTLSTAGAHKWWGNNTGSTAASGYETIGTADLPTGIPIANVGTSGLSGTAPVTISAGGAIGLATQAADTFLANDTSSTAVPTAVAMPTTNHGVWIAQGTGSAPVATAAGTAGQVFVSGGGSANPGWIDFPDTKTVPAANCVSSTAGSGWSTTLTAACRAGTNNLGGNLPFADASTAQFELEIPADWDTSTDPYVNLFFTTGANTSGTIIFQVQVSCYGSTNAGTDDQAFATAQVFATVTAASANYGNSKNLQLNSTSMTGCTAGGSMILKFTRNTDSASSTVPVTKAVVTIPRQIVVQAN